MLTSGARLRSGIAPLVYRLIAQQTPISKADILPLTGRVFAETLSEPKEFTLTVDSTVIEAEMSHEEVRRLAERYGKGADHKAR